MPADPSPASSAAFSRAWSCPSWSLSFAPQQLVTAPVTPQAWCAPWTTPAVTPSTVVGMGEGVPSECAPLPSSPLKFAPQHLAVPFRIEQLASSSRGDPRSSVDCERVACPSFAPSRASPPPSRLPSVAATAPSPTGAAAWWPGDAAVPVSPHEATTNAEANESAPHAHSADTRVSVIAPA